MDWKKTGKTLGIGAGIGVVGGVLDQFAAEQDAKNLAALVAAGKTQSWIKRWGTYVNYVIPVIEVGLVAFDVVKDEMAGSLATQAGQLAARKVMAYATSNHYTLNYSATALTRAAQWSKDVAKQDRYQRMPAAPTNQELPVPTVQPEYTFGGRGSLE
jgi:hypothetical protein